MMNGWDHGMDSGWWVFFSLLWLLLIVAIVWAAVRLFSGRSDSREVREAGDRPDTILETRLARGEIDVETYDTLRAKLHGGKA